MAASGRAQPTPTFTRPGSVVATELSGTATATASGAEKAVKVEDRWRAEVAFKTARSSTVTLEFSNGALLKLGAESEVAVEEFWQQPHSRAGKAVEWKEEPSPSRTRVRLARGDVRLMVKPLLTARGSSFALELLTGTVRIAQGALAVRVQMTEVGLGLCTLELLDGQAEFEPVGEAAARTLTAGKPLVLAVEIERGTGAVRLSDAPKEEGAKR